eukprot:TRINITY_DN17048_c0_g1_i1.p1 TRINITY_DN17048_c0_g1~~TRINITY_DN17048_c0_g1_i1.p1  ORF type:complete len:429 (+),score=129.64 TRINITY_DN17048_c0_g1_i1:99-1385(+)
MAAVPWPPPLGCCGEPVAGGYASGLMTPAPPLPPTRWRVALVPPGSCIASPGSMLPPPPLPPVPNELRARLYALEAQADSQAQADMFLERRLEAVTTQLSAATAQACRATGLEAELEQCRVEWAGKTALLEASEAKASFRATEHQEEASRAQLRCRELSAELELLRSELAQLQAERDDLKYAHDEARRGHEGSLERQAKEHSRRLREVTTLHLDVSGEAEQLRSEVKRLQEMEERAQRAETLLAGEQRRLGEERRAREDLERQVSSLEAATRSLRSYEARFKASEDEVVALRKQIRDMAAERTRRDEDLSVLQADLARYQRAEAERLLAERTLRDSLNAELSSNKLLHKETERLKAEVDSLRARMKLQTDGEIMRRYSATFDEHNIYASGPSYSDGDSSEVVVDVREAIEVDITDDQILDEDVYRPRR